MKIALLCRNPHLYSHQRLIAAARDRGIRVMTGVTLRENTRMIDLSRSLGFTARIDADEPELVHMTLVL